MMHEKHTKDRKRMLKVRYPKSRLGLLSFPSNIKIVLLRLDIVDVDRKGHTT